MGPLTSNAVRYRYPLIAAAVGSIAGLCSLPVWAGDEGDGQLEEILVTATRRSEALSKVPVSVAAINQDQMDARGLKDIDALTRYTPGLVFARAGNGGNNISIRGISSGAGAGTTGIYIDDTPIQVRNLAYSAGNAFPSLFDLERVEVLRGPQGTLFGAGSEGGTIRFIQTAPDLNKTSAYSRAEWSTTEGGAPSYEIGGAFGTPIVDGRLAFRLSAFYREDGGYIDGVSGTPVVVDPTGASGPASLKFTNVTVTRKNTNSSDTTGLRGALKFSVTDNLTVSPSVTYQKIGVNDGFDGFWSSLSSGGQYARPVFDAAPATAGSRFTALTSPNKDAGNDRFYLPAIQLDWNLGPVSLASNTSYFDRDFRQFFDFTSYYLWFYGQTPGGYPRPGDKSSSEYHNTQHNFVQEVRVQSNDENSRFKWVAGAFYARDSQRGIQHIGENFLSKSPVVGWFFFPTFLRGVDGGDPFGAGSSAFKNWFGVDEGPESYIWSINFKSKDTQYAAFAETEFQIVDRLKLIAGVRVSKNEVDFGADYSDPENNLTLPLASPGPVLPPLYSTVKVKTSETATTPRVGLSFQATENSLIYASAAKGFRPPGASQRLPIGCNQDLVDLGYVDGSGNPSQPFRYNSDSVWSYEVGAKSKLAGGRVVLDGSVYEVKWKDIQTSVFLQGCAESFVANMSDATSKGFDLAVQLYPLKALSITGNVGYNSTQFDKSGISPGGVAIVTDGTYVAGSPPPWVWSLSGQYDFHLFGDRSFFVRADLTHRDEARRLGATDPASPSYNAGARPAESYSLLSARVGMDVLGAQVSLFGNNLANAAPDLAYANRSLSAGFTSYTYVNQTVRPRTVGVSVNYRY